SLNMSLINGKTLGAAWFVSNCYASSGREIYAEKLKQYYPVETYGACSDEFLRCEHGGYCERMLDTQ
ncbi:hypothetical protein TELCIR_19786, partial [Teladorsagia circumcincta]